MNILSQTLPPGLGLLVMNDTRLTFMIIEMSLDGTKVFPKDKLLSKVITLMEKMRRFHLAKFFPKKEKIILLIKI